MAVTVEAPYRAMAPSGPSTLSLEDKFEVLKEIGDGSFGSVVLARVRTAGSYVARRGTIVAVKTMKKTFESFTPCMELREVVFLRTLPQHPHLVPAYDIFLDPYSKRLHICMEYMDGNLYQLMKSRDHKCLDNSSVKSILYQIMQGLEHIHAHHFFHRDIKPENILVSTSAHTDTNAFRRYSGLATPPQTPPTYTVKIADFGLARETHSKLPYTTYVSTRWYRAPEVLLRAGEYSAPVDIWAVGAMAVEIATLKPLFPGGNEVDQVWRVCEIMGSPGNWLNKAGARVGGGDWREGTRLAGKLGFSFPKMAPHSMETILPSPQWPASLSNFVTSCLLWDPKNRPTSTQAIAHEYFADAVDPTRPKSSTSRVLGSKKSDLGHRNSTKESNPSTTPTSATAKSSWFRKSLIGGRPEAVDPVAAQQLQQQQQQQLQQQIQQPSPKELTGPRPVPVHAATATAVEGVTMAKARPSASKRSTWASGQANVAPMPILPSIRPISPLSDAVTAQAKSASQYDLYSHAMSRATVGDDKSGKKIGRQLSMTSSNHYAEMHRHNAERALNGSTGLASPPSAHKEGFFSHLRKRARRFSGRHQSPMSPSYDDLEAQVGCAPWGSNRSSMVIDTQSTISPRPDVYDSSGKHMHSPQAPAVPPHFTTPSNSLKRHHSLPKQQPRSVDSLIGAARAAGPVSSRTRRAQATQGVHQYEAPAEEDELLDEALTNTKRAMNHMQKEEKLTLQQTASHVTIPNPYPTPSPSTSGHFMLYSEFGEGPGLGLGLTPKPLDLKKDSIHDNYTWPTPPYEESEWAASASASIWAASNRV